MYTLTFCNAEFKRNWCLKITFLQSVRVNCAFWLQRSIEIRCNTSWKIGPFVRVKLREHWGLESKNNPPGEANISLQKKLPSNKKIRIPKYREIILLAEFGILYFGIRNTAPGIRYPTNDWNLDDNGIKYLESEIQNPRLCWLLLFPWGDKPLLKYHFFVTMRLLWSLTRKLKDTGDSFSPWVKDMTNGKSGKPLLTVFQLITACHRILYPALVS